MSATFDEIDHTYGELESRRSGIRPLRVDPGSRH